MAINKNEFLATTLKRLRYASVARECGVNSRQVVFRWSKKGLPYTELLPSNHPDRTNYAAVIAKMAKCKKADLLKIEG